MNHRNSWGGLPFFDRHHTGLTRHLQAWVEQVTCNPARVDELSTFAQSPPASASAMALPYADARGVPAWVGRGSEQVAALGRVGVLA